MASQAVIVVGGGLAGLTAVIELLEKGCSVVLLDKEDNLGGNSSKATNGIAAPGSRWQKEAKISDTMADVAPNPEVAGLLTKATETLEWLASTLKLEKELALRLTPGHKVKRTVGTKNFFPGMVVTYAAIEALKKIAAARPDLLAIQNGARVQKLIVKGGKVTGVQYEQGGAVQSVEGPVVLATGGFLGDQSKSSVLSKQRPDLLSMATTNDDRASGDGIVMGTSVGAATKNLDKVSIFPTALVMPGRESDQFKPVISDAMCGAGAVLIDATGKRFCDEMAPAEERSAAIMKARGPVRLVMAQACAKEVEWLAGFYEKKSLLKLLDVDQIAAAMKIKEADLKEVIKPGLHYVAQVTPALYSCAGGLATSGSAEVLKSDGKPVGGLFAAGEVSAQQHPDLWGISGMPLLLSIYEGRLAGGSAAARFLGDGAAAPTSLAALVLEAITGLDSQQEPTKIAAEAPAAEPSKEEKKKLEDMSKEELIKLVQDYEKNGPPAGAGGGAPAEPGITMADVAKHNTKGDGWVVLFGEAYDVTKWIPIHPGGEKAIEAYLGQDATEEWQMIHKPGTIEKNMQHLTKMGKIGGGGGGGGGAVAPAADSGKISMDEVAKHNTKEDAWVVVNGQAIDVTKFIAVHPGGVQAIMGFIGKDATEEWVMIHKPGTVERMAKTENGPVVIGPVDGKSVAQAPPGEVDDTPPCPEGENGIPGVLGAGIFLGINVLIQVAKTIFFTGNFKLDNNRNGTIRSAIFLLTFTIVHVLGNFTDMIGGANEANGEGYFFDRLYWTGLGLPASIVEEYLALGLLLHITVALKRSWDISINYCLHTGRWNMLISGLVVLSFLIKHLSDFRFASDIKETMLRVPPYYISFNGITEMRLFWEKDESIEPIRVRDLYSKEVLLFKDLGTCLFYSACVFTFVLHMMLGWQKLVPADTLQIPRGHQTRVKYMGWALALAIGFMYTSVVWFTYFTEPELVEAAPAA